MREMKRWRLLFRTLYATTRSQSRTAEEAGREKVDSDDIVIVIATVFGKLIDSKSRKQSSRASVAPVSQGEIAMHCTQRKEKLASTSNYCFFPESPREESH